MSAKPYRIVVWWQSGLVIVPAESDNPMDLKGAPMVARDPRVIRRIELHDMTGCLETIWDASWNQGGLK